jgi:hypothetical protein
MRYSDDTDWKLSAKGNYWRKCSGIMLIVGGSFEIGYWVRVGEEFLEEKFNSLDEAQVSAERGV